MEKKFILYILYLTLIELRHENSENGNRRLYLIADILHNVPLTLIEDGEILGAYNNIVENAKAFEMEKWLSQMKQQFYNAFPEYFGKL